MFVNLAGGTRFAPWRPGSVYDLVTRLGRDLAGQVPAGWTPHWMRHSHATALLLSGVPPHRVSRRLGHADVQTTLEPYAHVTDDADMRAVAEWRRSPRAGGPPAARTGSARERDHRGGADGLPGAGSGHDEAVLERLWASVPPGMRLPRLSAGTVPALYQGGFAEGRKARTMIDVSGLPGPMRREVTWCVFRVIELGGRIQVHGAAM